MNDLNEVYSSLPEDVNTDYSSESKNELRRVLFLEPNELFSSKNLQEFGFFRTNVALRKAITELIELEHLPIVGTAKGYILTTYKEDIDKYIESLESRQLGLQKRIDALRIARGKING